jgi:hypothetical protein
MVFGNPAAFVSIRCVKHTVPYTRGCSVTQYYCGRVGQESVGAQEIHLSDRVLLSHVRLGA